MEYVYVVLLGVLTFYLFMMALFAKHKLFNSPYAKEGKEAQYKRTARIGVFAMAGLMLGLTVVSLLAAGIPEGDPALIGLGNVNFILTVLLLTGMLVILVLLNRLQDKEKKKLPGRPAAPRAAFYFDDDESAAPSKKPAPKTPGKKK